MAIVRRNFMRAHTSKVLINEEVFGLSGSNRYRFWLSLLPRSIDDFGLDASRPALLGGQQPQEA